MTPNVCSARCGLVGWAALNDKGVAAMEELRPILYGVSDYTDEMPAQASWMDVGICVIGNGMTKTPNEHQ